MKTVAALIALTLATPALAAPGSDRQTRQQADSAALDDGACFAEGRSYYSRMYAQETDYSAGTFLRERQGYNPEINRQWTENFCISEADEG